MGKFFRFTYRKSIEFLRPLLFLFYIIVLSICFSTPNASVGLYEDDSCLNVYPKQDPKNVMNEVLSKVSTWLKVNRLSLKVSRICFVKFTGCRSNSKVANVRYTIAEVDWVSFLDLRLENRLNFQYHVSTACNRISKLVGLIKFSKQGLNQIK